jgi:hypothetical protein
MRVDALLGGAFVFLEPEQGKEILGEIRDFNSPPILGSKAAKRDDVELPRSIFKSLSLHSYSRFALVKDIVPDWQESMGKST